MTGLPEFIALFGAGAAGLSEGAGDSLPWILKHAPALIVVVPLIMAPVTALLVSGRLAWLSTLMATGLSAFFSVILLIHVLSHGPVSYALGGWPAPWGIEYYADALSAAMLVLVSIAGFLCSITALPSVSDQVEKRRQAPFYATFLVCLTGLLGMCVTGDAFNFFVFLEISSISTYALVAMGGRRDRRALVASYNYLIMGTVGATFFVIGVGFLYMVTGTLNMVDIAARLAELHPDNRVVDVAFAFIVIGLALKVAVFPMHMWLPGAYAYAPSFVSSFLASTATKVAFYGLVRFVFGVFHAEHALQGVGLVWLLAPLGAVGMIAGSFQAIFQTDIRRTLAFSSIAQIGYMLLGIGMATLAGLSAGLLHLFNHALMKGTLFIALGAMTLNLGITRLADFRGLGRSMPWTMAAFTLGSLSLIGIPGTAGFVSKWALLTAALEKGWVWAVAVIALSSVLALVYLGRLLEQAYLHAPPSSQTGEVLKKRASLLLLLPLWVMALANLWFGLWGAGAEIDVIRAAAEAASQSGGRFP